ncbi:hypothetical protein [Hoeflea sp.]|uniref:hypothetical protein n=1 Tax=Hoeflea sp. TaxID=1940281 RepID=UPI003B02A3B0
MAKRSIYAQIDEVAGILERRRCGMSRARGAERSRMEEHVLRLQSVLATLEFVRDHREIIRHLAARDRPASGTDTPAPAASPAAASGMSGAADRKAK